MNKRVLKRDIFTRSMCCIKRISYVLTIQCTIHMIVAIIQKSDDDARNSVTDFNAFDVLYRGEIKFY